MTELPQTDTVWQHVNGNYYKILLLTNTEAVPERRDTHPINVVYIGSNGNIWSKTVENFITRMTPVPTTLENYSEIDQALNEAIASSLFAIRYNLKQANAIVADHVKKDPDLAWAWHCVIACAAQDEGVSHAISNRTAARAMGMLFDVNTHPLIAERTVQSDGTDA